MRKSALSVLLGPDAPCQSDGKHAPACRGKMANMLLSVVIPIYNEEQAIPFLLKALDQVLLEIPWQHEIVFVNDGSRDGSLDLLREAALDPRIKVLSFPRNFGHQAAITAGLDFAAGDAIAVMDADLQDPPEVLREMIARVARSQAPVHIFGESGTGKELVARLVHENGSRREGPFVAVNCGAIPTELMESELFGHKRGSFTGAVADKKGLVQSAEGGTLFLDEVADLPLHMQVKLLRVVQEKTVRPIGEAREEAVDIRILSATHKNLSDLVADGRFREDLYYRINVIELRVPALRERTEDIGELAAAILSRLGKRLSMTPPQLTDPALLALHGYPFPGNVRELENVLERALTLATGGLIDREHIKLRATARPPAKASIVGTRESSGTLGTQLEDMERDAIVKALEKTRYNKTAAAKLLGMSFRALRYRVKKLGIE